MVLCGILILLTIFLTALVGTPKTEGLETYRNDLGKLIGIKYSKYSVKYDVYRK